MEATLQDWPLVLPTLDAQRHQLYDLLFNWREKPGLLPGSTLRLGDRHNGNTASPIMITKLRKAAKSRRHGDAALSLPVNVPKAVRVRPVAFTKQYTDVANLTPVSTGPDRESQVYRGTLGPPPSVSLSSASEDTADVIVKIYQTSQMEVDSWRLLGDEELDKVALATNVLQDFEQEIWAYDRLSSLQGSVVPYVYGFFRIVLPHGEPCIALVEEYIPAMKQQDFFKSLGNNQANALCTLGDNLSTAVHALHTCGVYQRDLAGRNVLLPIHDPTFPVLIDFAHVSVAQSSDLFSAVRQILNTLVDIGFDKKAVKEWAKGKIRDDKSWVISFDVPNDDSNHLAIMLFE